MFFISRSSLRNTNKPTYFDWRSLLGKAITSSLLGLSFFTFGPAWLPGCAQKIKQPSSPLTEGPVTEITLLHFADSHAQWEEHPEMFWNEQGEVTSIVPTGGFPRMKAVVDEFRKTDPEGVLLLDGGDTIQGSAWAVKSKGADLVPVLNLMGIDLAIPGNWEVVYGTATFQEIAKKLKYRFIAANVFDEKSGELVFPPYLIIEKKGVRLAFIGYTDPDVPERQPPSYSKGFIYKKDEVLPPLIREIREQNKADAVILMSHIGLPKAVELSSRLDGVDLHLSADTHERTYTPIMKKHPVVEPGAFTSFLG